MLRYTDGNKRQAAHLLGISRSTLLHKVRKYGLADTGGS
jgi:DNA-binding protein Fis